MSKIKITPNYKKKADPHVADYWKGFNDGNAHGIKTSIEYLRMKLDGLREVEGIGEVRFQKIMDYINKEWGN